jgi:hypothetical protein
MLLSAFLIEFAREFIKREFNYLADLHLGVERLEKSTLLCNLQEFDVEVLPGHAAVADAKLHEQIFELELGWVVHRRHPHGVCPKAHGVIQVLSLGQAVVEQSHAHLQNNATIGLVCKEMLEHVDERIVDLI